MKTVASNIRSHGSVLRNREHPLLPFFCWLLNVGQLQKREPDPLVPLLRKAEKLTRILDRGTVVDPLSRVLIHQEVEAAKTALQTAMEIYDRGETTFSGALGMTTAPNCLGNVDEKERLFAAVIVAKSIWPQENAYSAVREELASQPGGWRQQKAVEMLVRRFEKEQIEYWQRAGAVGIDRMALARTTVFKQYTKFKIHTTSKQQLRFVEFSGFWYTDIEGKAYLPHEHTLSEVEKVLLEAVLKNAEAKTHNRVKA